MKQEYCENCFFNTYESIGCVAQQLNWEVKNLIRSTPLGAMVYKAVYGTTEPRRCEHFEPIDAEKVVEHENRHTDAGSASGAEGQAGKYPGEDGAGECSAGSDCRGKEEAAADGAQA